MSTELVVVNPATGELLEHLDQQPPETLADALAAIRTRQDEAARMAGALEGELRRRLAMRGRKLAVYGTWEVEAQGTRESVWDADELEGAIDALIAEGTVRAAEVVDIITRPPVVSRSKAKALASRLDGDNRALINAACSWRDKPGKLTLTRSVELPTVDEHGELVREAPLDPPPNPQTSPAPPALDLADLFA